MKVIGWRAWYDNSMVYDSKTSSWSDLPSDGLVVLVIYSDKGKQIHTDETYYWTTPESELQIFAGNKHPKDEHPGAIVKLGVNVSPNRMRRIAEQAKNSIFRQ